MAELEQEDLIYFNISIRQVSVCLSVCQCVSFRALSRRVRLFSNKYGQYKYVDLLYVPYCTILTIISAGKNTTSEYVDLIFCSAVPFRQEVRTVFLDILDYLP